MMALLQSQRVRLVAPNPETDGEALARWSRDSEFLRLFDSRPAQPEAVKQFTQHLKDWMTPENTFLFLIRTLADDRLIGLVELEGIRWAHADGWLSIGLGERNDWGKGYGAEALQLILRYGFAELNLHRISLSVFEYNPRAIHTYEKAGFVVEGRMRQVLHRDGRRWDLIYMGILKEEWKHD
jgi:RimJ/RimL family protein N-acetyltransferase